MARYAIAYFGMWVALLTPTSLTLGVRAKQVAPDGAAELLSLVLGVGSALAIICNPLFGKLSDRTRSPRRGRTGATRHRGQEEQGPGAVIGTNRRPRAGCGEGEELICPAKPFLEAAATRGRGLWIDGAYGAEGLDRCRG